MPAWRAETTGPGPAVRGLASGVRASNSVSAMQHEDHRHRDHGDQRPGQVLVEVLPTEPAHDRDEEHLGQVDAVGVVRAGLHQRPGPRRSASMHQRHADQVDGGDGPDVERDHDRLEGIGARAEPRHHVVGGQVVPDLGCDGSRQRARAMSSTCDRASRGTRRGAWRRPCRPPDRTGTRSPRAWPSSPASTPAPGPSAWRTRVRSAPGRSPAVRGRDGRRSCGAARSNGKRA